MDTDKLIFLHFLRLFRDKNRSSDLFVISKIITTITASKLLSNESLKQGQSDRRRYCLEYISL